MRLNIKNYLLLKLECFRIVLFKLISTNKMLFLEYYLHVLTVSYLEYLNYNYKKPGKWVAFCCTIGQ